MSYNHAHDNPPSHRQTVARVLLRARKGISPRPTRRAPRQERSRDTVACILQAAAAVFGRLGYAGTTTNKIAERAGVSIGSLYQYFANKDELLLVLLERHRREVRSVIDAARVELADPETPLDQGLRRLLEGLLDLHARDPALSRVLAHGIHRPEGRGMPKHEEDDRYAEVVRAILDARPEVKVGDTGMAARLVVQTVEQLIRYLGHEAPPGLDKGAFVDETLAMLLRYLTGGRSTGRCRP